jgi:hypothetical protein
MRGHQLRMSTADAAHLHRVEAEQVRLQRVALLVREALGSRLANLRSIRELLVDRPDERPLPRA